MPKKPKLSEIKEHFKNAAEVRCAKNGTLIDVSSGMEPIFKNGSYSIANGMISLWFEGVYAPITKHKPKVKCECETCNCAEKKKLAKRNPKK